MAAVHCVIIGFALGDGASKSLYEYDEPTSDPHLVQAKNISPYLVAAPDLLLSNRDAPLCDVPAMRYGNMPRDDGQLLLTDSEKHALEAAEPGAVAVIKPFVSAKEFLNNERRWCLWLKDVQPAVLRGLPEVLKRVENVRRFRLASKAASTRGFAATPGLFAQIAQPSSRYLLVPRHSSENRRYIPLGFFTPDHIVADSCLFVPDATPYHFGVMSSEMHMAWVRATCGRLESRYRYSKDIVYNNFPWPEPTAAQRAAIEKAAQHALDVRHKHSTASLADLYDPLAMPPDLVAAHTALDRAVDAAYRRSAFVSEAERVAYLFQRYQVLSAPLLPAAPPGKRRRKAAPIQ